MQKKKCFSMMEILVVVIILGILVSLAIVNYTRSITLARDRDARSMVRLLQAAEETIFGETSVYPLCGSTALCNNALRLTINSTWAFTVVAHASGFQVVATDPHDAGHTYTIIHNQACPSCTAGASTCPADLCH
jgi:type II secretory pathway pseudopilin PulG